MRYWATFFFLGVMFCASPASAQTTSPESSVLAMTPTTDLIARDEGGTYGKTLAELCQELLDSWRVVDKAINTPGCYVNVRCHYLLYRLRSVQRHTEALYQEYGCASITGTLPPAPPL